MQAQTTAKGRLLRMRLRREIREDSRYNSAFIYMRRVNESVMRDPMLRREGVSFKGWLSILIIVIAASVVIFPTLAEIL